MRSIIKLFLISLLLCIVLTNNAFSTTLSASYFLRNTKHNASYSQNNQEFLTLQINETKLLQAIKISKTLLISDFPVGCNEFDEIQLNEVKNVIDANTQFVTQTINGEIRIRGPECHYFEGKIKNEKESVVSISVADGITYGFIQHSDGRSYILAPSKIQDSNSGNYILISQNVLNADRQAIKELYIENKLSDIIKQKNLDKPLALSWENLLETELALETDSEFYKANGSDIKKAQAYSIALINLVSRIYTRDINVCFYLKWLKTWTDYPSDPYDVKGDAYQLPNKVLSYWKSNYSKVERDAAHVITSISYGGGGFGYFNGLCGKAGDYSFSVSSVQSGHQFPTVDFTYDVYIVAHELGHNFNASHTHSCDFGYPLDTCIVDDAIAGKCLPAGTTAKPNPGSLMSYCGSANNAAGLGYTLRMFFLEQNRNQMRTEAEKAPCLSAPSKPFLMLNAPQGKEILSAGQKFQIKWSSSSVNNINISITTDNGLTWTEIAKGLDAADLSFDWTVPEICSNNVLMKLTDPLTDSTAVNDIPFSISITDTSNLVAFYTFDGNFIDMKPCHNYNLKSTGNVTLTNDRNGKANSAAHFDGSSYLSNSKFPFNMEELTFSFWFKPSETTQKHTILGTNFQEGWVTEIYIWGLFGAAIWVDNQGVPKQIWGSSITSNQWYHGAFTWDGTKGKLYMNGKLVSELNDGEHKLNKFAPTPFYVGGRKNNDYFEGDIDDISVYKKALTAEQISAYYDFNVNVAEESTYSDKFEIYPNPSNDVIYINYESKQHFQENIRIINVIGNVVKLIKSDASNKDFISIRIDISDLEHGVYILQNGNRTAKFIKY